MFFSKKDLLKHLEKDTKVLSDRAIRNAFERIDRKQFVHDDYKIEAYEDYPLPIGFGQTISQPTTVAFMLELLGAEKGDRVLDVGCGSGWTTGLLAEIVGDTGRVFGVDIIPELVLYAKRSLIPYNFKHTRIAIAGDTIGLKEEAPFDKILVSASANYIPQTLIEQMRIGGTIVLPVGETIVKGVKVHDTELEKEVYEGFVFVPLLENEKRR